MWLCHHCREGCLKAPSVEGPCKGMAPGGTNDLEVVVLQ